MLVSVSVHVLKSEICVRALKTVSFEARVLLFEDLSLSFSSSLSLCSGARVIGVWRATCSQQERGGIGAPLVCR